MTFNDWIQHFGIGLLIAIIAAMIWDMSMPLFIATAICGVCGAWIGCAQARARSKQSKQ